MAFTLKIRSEELGKTKTIDFKRILSNCSLEFGENDEFYILRESKLANGSAVLYNPKRIGRGIFFDGNNAGEGEITINYNIPTTAAEIKDFINVAKEIEAQLGRVTMFCEEEEREYTSKMLDENMDNMIAFSVKSLNEFCCNTDYKTYIFTLAMFPWFLPQNKVDEYKTCDNLDDFEETLHGLQALDLYYAKPSVMRNGQTGQIAAFYTLTEDCPSVFPVAANMFLNLDNIKIDQGFIRFYIFSEKRPLEGFYDYNEFIELLLKEKKAGIFDANHIVVPSLSKKDIEELVGKLVR